MAYTYVLRMEQRFCGELKTSNEIESAVGRNLVEVPAVVVVVVVTNTHIFFYLVPISTARLTLL